MTAPERIWHTLDRKGKIRTDPDAHVKPTEAVASAYEGYVHERLYTAQQETIAALVEALEECEAEIDDYIRQEYPSDHPVHERYRQRDFSANPARIALARAKEQA